MKPTDPFETEALSELRSEQRQALRLIPDSYVEFYAPKQPIERPSSDTALLETQLRAMADAVHQEELTDLPRQWGERTRREILFDFIERPAADVVLRQQGRVQHHVFSDVIHSMKLEVEDAVTTHELGHEVAASLMRYLHLLAWADNLAADGYHDPRLPGPLRSSG